MSQFRTTLKKSLISFVAFVQLLGFSALAIPVRVSAEDAPPLPPPTCPAVNGTPAPTGVAAHTFTFRPADGPAPTCIWENAYYTWDPVTKIYTPKYDTHVCDASTGICENIEWAFITSDNHYVERRTVVYVPPAPPATTPTPPNQSNPAGGGPSGDLEQAVASSIVSNNGTNSNNSLTNNANLNGDINLANDVSVLMTLDSNAWSGDASALSNTSVGNVSSGDAAAIANILNMIQSSWDPANGDLTLFSADLFANYYGDLLFDPSIVLGNGANSNNAIAQNADTDLDINVSNDANIQNDINLNATSGNATANSNASAGDVSTGDANAIANVINMINSSINSGGSFIGSLNLHGDLNGDILLPSWLASVLLGNGANSNNTITNNADTDIDADINNDFSITNNTDLTAQSGAATAERNTSVGDVSTGDAATQVNQMNLIGQNVQNSHGLLVFVNVMGSWVGMLFGGGGTSSIAAGNGANSNNSISNSANTDIDADVNNNFGITNNLNLDATSGNATANSNTSVGDVSTGDATASVNLLNMINSNMNFTDWFGVLFINVFGNWNGSFGVDTASGEQPSGGAVAGAQTANTASSGGSSQSTTASTTAKVLAFVSSGGSNTGGTTTASAQSSGNALAAESDSSNSSRTGAPTVMLGTDSSGATSVWWITGVAGLISLLLLGGERVLLVLRKP